MFWYFGILGWNVIEEKKVIGDEKKEEVKFVIKGILFKLVDIGFVVKFGIVI